MSLHEKPYLVFEVWQPKSVKTLVEEIPVEEGKSLPCSPEEDVGSYSLAPTYSRKQLRRMNRINKRHKDMQKRLRKMESMYD